MWYVNKPTPEAKPPSKKEKWTLRILLVIGLCSMGFFLQQVLQPEYKGYEPLYYLLIFSLVFLCLKILYEWYHYFDISVPPPRELKKEYTVDVLTTFVPGEPYEMILQTLAAIQRIEYPHTTYLCDEGNDPYLREKCKELGVVHVYRGKDKTNAKAGNINYALRNHAQGEVALILDPDHIPTPSFLHEVLPYFDDPEIGFVQTVQGYYNFTENIIAKASAQQTYQFYGPIMMSMNSYGTAQAIGANCCFRREALNSIGGHAPGLAEDMNTSMKLHAKGWKSIYVPKMLTRGLVPSTISAYYKQQLKWSRGVFELLVTTYRKNFTKFTGRQKIHYGLLPWHYFSGVVYFLNFLIPMVALVFAKMPMTINMAYFFLVGMPFFASIVVIRHYVQRWVMDEDERGLHVQGGILLIGSWWIHMLGFVFTLLRRKVPYNPTPKDGQEENIYKQNIPNILIGLISILAIAYGLHFDFNPYSLAMAGFALVNIGFMVLMVLISYQNKYREYKKTHPLADKLAIFIWRGKRLFWLFRHSMYGYVRLLALPIIVLLVVGLFYYAFNKDLEDIEPLPPPEIKSSQYLGFYVPGDNQSISDLTKSDSLSRAVNLSPSIIATYLAWQPHGGKHFPKEYFQEVYERKAYPMITWEPWLQNFPQYDSTQSSMMQISMGKYDEYLRSMAVNFKALGKPVFIRFAHEPDNPYYSWYSSETNAASNYILAWRYVHRFMQNQGVRNLIWVFNPWSDNAATSYYPGDAYVDWLGVTALNYASAVSKGNWQSFEDIYAPFSRSLTFQRSKLVMLAEFGTLSGEGDTKQWFQDALNSIHAKYPQIRAVVLFGSQADAILPEGKSGRPLNWLAASHAFSGFAQFQQQVPLPQKVADSPTYEEAATKNELYRNMEGVNYLKSTDWQASMHPLFKEAIRHDFAAMGSLRLNWVKRYGPGIYDKNILAEAASQKVNILYASWVEKYIDYIADHEKLGQNAEAIIEAIAARKDEQQIKAWHIGNPVWDELAENYGKPELNYQRKAYLKWLQKLAQKIKKVDASRPLSIEVKYHPYLDEIIMEIAQAVPDIDAVGVIMPKGGLKVKNVSALDAMALPVFISRMDVQKPSVMQVLRVGWFINSWQDDVYSNHVSFTGLIDHEGRKKRQYLNLAQRWGEQVAINLPRVHVLRPAEIPFPGRMLEFDALVQKDSSWQYVETNPYGLSFDWYLIKTDNYGNALAMEKVGTGAQAYIEVPPQPFQYKVYLLGHKGGYTTSHISNLTTPVYWGPKLEELSAEQIDYLLVEDQAR